VFTDRLRLDDRAVIVFGAGGGGMGTATALAIADAGGNLVAFDITDDRVAETQRRIKASGGHSVGYAGDVRSVDDLANACALATSKFGRLDGVVNLVGGTRLERPGGTSRNAGTWLPLHEYPEDVYEDIFAVNLTYVFHSCQIAARTMLECGNGGSIVNFASVSALEGAPYHGPYGAAKAGVMSITKTLAVELGRQGIRANCIVPGSVPAPLSKAASSNTFDAITDRASLRSALGRRVDPVEIAGAVLFLLSNLSAGITGQCLNVDAGASAQSPLGTDTDYARTTEIRHAESVG
jgi:NAD(P)-dependent dehydrogenase (short-subunit alcohol dehydrogenase family)